MCAHTSATFTGWAISSVRAWRARCTHVKRSRHILKQLLPSSRPLLPAIAYGETPTHWGVSTSETGDAIMQDQRGAFRCLVPHLPAAWREQDPLFECTQVRWKATQGKREVTMLLSGVPCKISGAYLLPPMGEHQLPTPICCALLLGPFTLWYAQSSAVHCGAE